MVGNGHTDVTRLRLLQLVRRIFGNIGGAIMNSVLLFLESAGEAFIGLREGF